LTNPEWLQIRSINQGAVMTEKITSPKPSWPNVGNRRSGIALIIE
jgi:hypothetical protein